MRNPLDIMGNAAGHGTPGRAARSGEAVLVTDVAVPTHGGERPTSDMAGSELATPIRVDGEP